MWIPLQIKCRVLEVCHLVATAVLSRMTRIIGSLQSFQPAPMSGMWQVGGPMRSQWNRSCLRGPPGRQATMLPAEQTASCTEKPHFLICLPRFVLVWACSLQSFPQLCLYRCVFVCRSRACAPTVSAITLMQRWWPRNREIASWHISAAN